MLKRIFLLVAWIAVAGAATMTGVTAVGVVQDAVLGTRGVPTLTSSEVEAQLVPVSQASDLPSGTPTSAPPSRPAVVSPTPNASTAPGPTSNRTGSPQTPAASTVPSTPLKPTAMPTHKPSASPSSDSHGGSGPPTSSPNPTRKPSSAPPASQSGLIYSAGGSVVAQCTGSQVQLVTDSPAQGFRVKSADTGPADHIKVVFAPTSGAGDDVEVEITCRSGRPTDQGGGGGDDGGGHGGGGHDD